MIPTCGVGAGEFLAALCAGIAGDLVRDSSGCKCVIKMTRVIFLQAKLYYLFLSHDKRKST